MYRKITYCLVILFIFISGCSNNVQTLDDAKTIWKIKISSALSWIEPYINTCLDDYPQIQVLKTNETGDNIKDSDLDFIFSFKDDDLIYDHSYLLGYDHLVFVVNPINPVNELSEEQIKDIFQGNIDKWSTISPDTLAEDNIQVITFLNQSQQMLLINNLLDINSTSINNFATVPSFAEMKTAISKTPNAIGFINYIDLEGSVKAISITDQTSKLQYPVIVSSKENLKGIKQTFITCLQKRIDEQ